MTLRLPRYENIYDIGNLNLISNPTSSIKISTSGNSTPDVTLTGSGGSSTANTGILELECSEFLIPAVSDWSKSQAVDSISSDKRYVRNNAGTSGGIIALDLYSDGSGDLAYQKTDGTWHAVQPSGDYTTRTELDEKTSQTYITNNIIIDPDTNNLLTKTSNGLLVELKAAPDVTNQYVSSSTGNDTTGDGSQSKPFKTIRRALNRVPDHTEVWIHLYSGDTFDFTDGADGYVENGTLSQVNSGSFDVGSRTITFLPYGNSIFDSMPAGVANDSPDIGSQPVIQFTYSKTSDTAQYTCPGFHLGSGTLYFTQISFTVKSDNLPSTSTTAAWSAPFNVNYGTVATYGCNFNLSNGVVFGADGGNESSGSVVLGYSNYYSTTNGTALMDASCGYTLRAAFSDNTGGSNITVNGKDTGLKQRASNFNSAVANSKSFLNLTVIDSTARIYQGLTTQNKLDN